MRAHVDFNGTLVVEAQDDVDDELLRDWMHRYSTDPTESVVIVMTNPKPENVPRESRH